MIPTEERCTSCGIPLQAERSVKFVCPKCQEQTIGRCGQCRNQSAVYLCPGCGFQGP
jgi:predicted RNA-binding Zn-ribbon protein involved in translation (DUF1610 family)